MTAYARQARLDEYSPYIPHRYSGRLHLRWDDDIRNNFDFRWPEQRGEAWNHVLSKINLMRYESDL